MRKNNIEYKNWLYQAQEDLNWTEANIREKIYYGACFTSQQSAEKSLKAFLLFHQNRFDKTHDLIKLLNDCIVYEKEFEKFKNKLAKLSYYYLESRYPDISEIQYISESDAKESFETAKNLLNFILSKI